MKAPHPRAALFFFGAALLVSSTLVGCGESKQPSTPPSPINVVPQGNPTEVALACGRASVLMYIMTLDDWPPDFRYLDPRSMPGFDANKKERGAIAAEYLGEAIEKLGVWDSSMVHDPKLLDRTLRENGWTIIEEGKKIAANERSWRNLEDRVAWCIDHYDVDVPERNEKAEPQPPQGKSAR
ncbi:MAG: hypothetical protein ABW034_22950 [Steroidobacteraceae bacterium]